MSALDLLIPAARLAEIDHADLAAPPEAVWQHVRHGDLGTSRLVRALFAIRSVPARLRGERDEGVLRIDDMISTADRPGFQLLVDEPPHELAVGAIGQVWKATIPFVHTENARTFAEFAEPGFVKVAWAIRVVPRGEQGSRVEIEVRVDATDEESWRKFRRYFRVVGVGSHLIRRTLLRALAARFGTDAAHENARPMIGDELIPGPAIQLTHAIDLQATPDAIWPWLVQMGRGRAGFYSYDALDNGGVRSARELHPEWMQLSVGDVVPVTAEGDDGFEVLRLDRPRVLILGVHANKEKSSVATRASCGNVKPLAVTWTFVLERLDDRTTRLHVRARGARASNGRLHDAWITPVHAFMEGAQLRNLAARVHGELARDDVRDVLAGIGGATQMLGAMLTPFRGDQRRSWGCDEALANARLPGDHIIAAPRSSWTHAVEIETPASEVWPWIAQVGADRGGFYSYQWLENVAGCALRNAETIHPEWQLRAGDRLLLHPDAPPLTVVELVPGSHLVAYGPGDRRQPVWSEGTWLFLVQPLEGGRCRFVSRFRTDYSDDFATRIAYAAGGAIGFVMDRRMLLGVKERAEAKARAQAKDRAHAATR